VASDATPARCARAADASVQAAHRVVGGLPPTRDGGTALAPPFLAKYALDDALHSHDFNFLLVIVGGFLAAGLAYWGMSYVQTYLTGWVGERMLADLRIELFAHLQRLSLGFYERNRAGC